MFSPDVEAQRMLVQEHQGELARNAVRDSRGKPDVMESRIRARRSRMHLPRFRFQLRPARPGS